MKMVYESETHFYRTADGTPLAEVALLGFEGLDSQTDAQKNLFEYRFTVNAIVLGEMISNLIELHKRLKRMELPEPLSEGDALEGGKNA